LLVGREARSARAAERKSFLVLFFKKELLPSRLLSLVGLNLSELFAGGYEAVSNLEKNGAISCAVLQSSP
jgi:hypothetical protein